MGKRRRGNKKQSTSSDSTTGTKRSKEDNDGNGEDQQEKEDISKKTSNDDDKKDSIDDGASACQNATIIEEGSFRTIQPPLCQGVIDFLDSKKFNMMTPVQEATIPLFLTNRDVAVQAVTGSGKTLAFLIPVIERIRKRRLNKNQIGALILSPTRELAMQTYLVCQALCESTKLAQPLLLVGGSSGGGGGGGSFRPVSEDLKTFKKEASDIVIGTPGRIEDVLTRYDVFDVSELDVLILDEADVLLFGKGVIDPSVACILSRLPKMRRTGIFSATTTFSNGRSIKPLLQRAGMRNPVLINVQVEATDKSDRQQNRGKGADKSKQNPPGVTYTPTSLTNFYIVSRVQEKIPRLVSFLREHREQKIIVFFLTCACVDFYGTSLKQILGATDTTKKGRKSSKNIDDSVNIELLHGKLVQKRREKTMKRFREGTGGVLFCTDVAARGLDVDDIQWVIQMDAPQDPSQFVHRVGRSGRAGRKGSSLVFLTEKEESYVEFLANRKVTLTELPDSERCTKAVQQNDSCSTKENDGTSTTATAASTTTSDDVKDSTMIEDCLPKIRQLVLKDRDILEKGTKAFTSYIRAYKEHVCSFIFRLDSLDFGQLANSFCLVRLPKMPELRECNKNRIKNFVPAGNDVDVSAIPFLDKARESARQKRAAAIAADRAEREAGGGPKSVREEKEQQRRAAAERKQQEWKKLAIDKGLNPNVKRGRHAELVEEWEDLAKEERLYKKLRRGKISQAQYKELLRGGSTVNKSTPSNDVESDDDSTDS